MPLSSFRFPISLVTKARLARLLPALLVPLLLVSCGPARNEFPPICPSPAFLRELSDLTRYRPGSNGRDLTDLVVQARLASLQGQCEEGSNKNELKTTVTVAVEMVRGPAMQGRQVMVPIFIAVTEGETVITKEVYATAFEFPSNVDRVAIATPPVQLVLPVSPQKSGAAYGIIVGFQLSPEERDLNRHRAGGR